MDVTFEQAHAYWQKRSGEYKLPTKDKISLHCPFHGNDRNPSLELNLGKGGIWKCFACGLSGGLFHFEKQMFGRIDGRELSDAEIWQRIHEITGIPVNTGSGGGFKHGPVIASYRYTDVDGKLIFWHDKHAPAEEGGRKTFTFRAPNDRGGWDYSLKNVKERPLYHLPELRESAVVFCCEGEKDCDRLRAAMGGTDDATPRIKDRKGREHSLAVVCNFDGAGKWLPEYNGHFTGRHVAIFADNDQPGRDHAATVAAALVGVAQSVKVVHLSGLPDKGDVSDYLDAHAIEDLLAELHSAPLYRSQASISVEVSKPFFEKPADMVKNGLPQIDWLMPRVVHQGSRGLIVAAPKVGKSMIGLDLVLALSTGQPWLGLHPAAPVRTAVISREDSPAMTLSRLAELSRGRGIRMEDIEHLHLNTFAQRSTFAIDKDEDLKQLCEAVKAEGIKFVLCDVLNRLHSGQAEENSNSDMTRLMARFDIVKMETGADIAIIHHDTKNSTPGAKKPRGASAIDGWWDWKISIDVDADDQNLKRVFFSTKAAQSHHPLAVRFASHPVMGMQVQLVEEQRDVELITPRGQVVPFGRSGTLIAP